MNVKHEELTVRALYDLSYTAARPLLEACTYPWEALPKIGEFIKALGKTLSPEEYEQRGEDVWVAKSANNYIGDSVMGHKAHTGAGAVTSNLKQDHSNVTVLKDGERVETGMRKFGAMLGDHAEIGCGSVLNPGTVVGKNARVYPLSMVRGFVPANHIYKKAGEIAEIHD